MEPAFTVLSDAPISAPSEPEAAGASLPAALRLQNKYIVVHNKFNVVTLFVK